jgi:serine/threonine-protein kinase RsbT
MRVDSTAPGVFGLDAGETRGRVDVHLYVAEPAVGRTAAPARPVERSPAPRTRAPFSCAADKLAERRRMSSLVAMMTPVRLQIRDDSDIVAVRRSIREFGHMQCLAETAIEALATAATEIARNLIVHAGGGELVIEATTAENSSRRGVLVRAHDLGPGIADVDLAMQDGYSTRGSLGLGLPSAKRLVDEFAIQSTLGNGTIVTLRKWA